MKSKLPGQLWYLTKTVWYVLSVSAHKVGDHWSLRSTGNSLTFSLKSAQRFVSESSCEHWVRNKSFGGWNLYPLEIPIRPPKAGKKFKRVVTPYGILKVLENQLCFPSMVD